MALALNLGVLLAAADQYGQVTLLVVLYTGLSLALAIWEQGPLTLSLPAAYGLFAVPAAWTAILFGRDQWGRWLHALEAWWEAPLSASS